MVRFNSLKNFEDVEKKLNIKKLSTEELLGRRLNRFEKKYAPKTVYVKGAMKIPLPSPRVSVVGTRNPSSEGIEAAREITKFLVENGVVVVSGLAKGIDTVAHKTAIELEGKTIAVLGTPLNRFYPAENKKLQKLIMENHLAISQYPVGFVTKPKHFVMRNRTMALISDATVIVEAGEKSGVISQGWETLRLGKPLFIWRLLAEKGLKWVDEMIEYGAIVLENVHDLKYTIMELLPPPEEDFRFEALEVEV